MGVFAVGIFDVATTHYGLRHGFIEMNPLGQVMVASLGVWAMVGIKSIAIGIGVIVSHLLDQRKYLVPAIFILVWGLVVFSNVSLLLSIS